MLTELGFVEKGCVFTHIDELARYNVIINREYIVVKAAVRFDNKDYEREWIYGIDQLSSSNVGMKEAVLLALKNTLMTSVRDLMKDYLDNSILKEV